MKTQGQRLIALLERQPMTTLELLKTGISTCPWKRIAESMPEDKELKSTKMRVGQHEKLNVYRVVRVKKYVPKTVWQKPLDK